MIEHPSHAPHSTPALTPMNGRLAVVTAIMNPQRYRSRYRLYRQFEKHIADGGADLFTVECAFGDRPFEVTEAGNPRHLQLRSPAELWLKENLLNLVIQRVPREYGYIAWVDADMSFVRPDWAQETLHQLQHHPVVQMFSNVHYLTAEHGIEYSRLSFGERWRNGYSFKTPMGVMRRSVWPYKGEQVQEKEYGDGEWGPPGGGWAFRREALDNVGGLIDFCILGSGDWFMAAGMGGFMEQALPAKYSPGLRHALTQWGERAHRVFAGDIGVVPGALLHHFHGSMSNRGYGTRETILHRSNYDPLTDIHRDSYGVLALSMDGSPRLRQLRDDIRAYFRSRNEDEG